MTGSVGCGVEPAGEDELEGVEGWFRSHGLASSFGAGGSSERTMRYGNLRAACSVGRCVRVLHGVGADYRTTIGVNTVSARVS